jgi:hypothetical protein
MAAETGQPAAARPAAVAIHDDGYVHGQAPAHFDRLEQVDRGRLTT